MDAMTFTRKPNGCRKQRRRVVVKQAAAPALKCPGWRRYLRAWGEYCLHPPLAVIGHRPRRRKTHDRETYTNLNQRCVTQICTTRMRSYKAK